MGGPVNKIAFLFGIAQIVEGNFDVMAAVMAGGMVPPLAIAISTTFFRNKFTLTERKLGCQNYLKGLMFISEGDNLMIGNFYQVQVIDSDEFDLFGEII